MDRLALALQEAHAQHADAVLACLHVRRGDKVSRVGQQARYPNLDFETSPEGILQTIKPHVPQGSVLYIATNEPEVATFFEPLRERYSVFTLVHIPDILNPKDFLGSSLAMIDYEILDKCPQVIPTFNSEHTKGFEQHITLSKSDK
ncbi:hypothetical protein JKP88DRAFT_230524 [Tribonema minus]|uniref:Uncharacterized protein n=1 Tax=Tribonema minus TaxID=303371 RepID=A0A835ZIW3_9STRA|nr:hypothetical protein JKP88DRAFT_230524 [Tribonema minus]